MNPTMNDILKVVARTYRMDVAQLLQRTRRPAIAHPRMIAMWIARDMTKMSLVTIGEKLNNMDHTTVMHGIREVEKKMTADREFATSVRGLQKTILEAVTRRHQEESVQLAALKKRSDDLRIEAFKDSLRAS